MDFAKNGTAKIISNTKAPSVINNTTTGISLTVSIAIVFTNFIEIIILSKRRRRKVYEKLLLSLSMSDLFSGFAEIAMTGTYYAKLQDVDVFKVKNTLFAFFLCTSIMHQILLALDRLYAVKFPIQHNIVTSGRKTVAVIAGTWLVNAIAAVACVTIVEIDTKNIEEDKKSWPQTKSFFKTVLRVVSVLILLAEVVFVIAYSMVVHEVRKTPVIKQLHASRYRHQKRVTRLCLLITGSFVVTTMPYILLHILPKHLTTSIDRHTANHWSRLLVISNALFNSVIYLLQNHWKRLLRVKSEITLATFRKTQN